VQLPAPVGHETGILAFVSFATIVPARSGCEGASVFVEGTHRSRAAVASTILESSNWLRTTTFCVDLRGQLSNLPDPLERVLLERVLPKTSGKPGGCS
jgi:hypothetical protein